MPEVLRDLAEYPNAFIAPTPGSERIETDRFTLCLTPRGATVQRQRFADDELDEVLAEVRALPRARGRTRTQWEIGSQATPAGLAATLERRGFTRDDEPWALALALTEPPAELAPVTGLRAAQVITAEDFVAARAVQDAAFGATPEQVQAGRERHLEEFWAFDASRGDRPWSQVPHMVHAVWAQDRIVCAGTCSRTRLAPPCSAGRRCPSSAAAGPTAR